MELKKLVYENKTYPERVAVVCEIHMVKIKLNSHDKMMSFIDLSKNVPEQAERLIRNVEMFEAKIKKNLAL